MKRSIFALIVFSSMISYSYGQTKYSDTVKNVLGVNIFPVLTMLNQQYMSEQYLYFSYKHFFNKGALRIGAFLGSKDEYRYNDEYIVTVNDTSHTFHSITGYSNMVGLKLGYEWRKQLRPRLFFSFGGDLTGGFNKIDLSDVHYTISKMTDTTYIRSASSINSVNGYHSLFRIGFSPFIAYEYILSKKLSLTAQLNYDWYSEHSIDANYNSGSLTGGPSINLMLNYRFLKRK